MAKKRLLVLVLVVMVMLLPSVMAQVDYSNYCEDNSALATDPQDWCEDHVYSFVPDGCSYAILSCEPQYTGGMPPTFSYCITPSLFMDATDCAYISSFTSLSLICIGGAVYDSNEQLACSAGCENGVQFAKVLDACGGTGDSSEKEYSLCFEPDSACLSTGICIELTAQYDFETGLDPVYTAHMLNQADMWEWYCVDDDTKGKHVYTFEPVQCDYETTVPSFDVGFNTYGFTIDYTTYYHQGFNQIICGSGHLCYVSPLSGEVSCVPEEEYGIDFPISPDFCESPENLPVAHIDRPEENESFPIGAGVWYDMDQVINPKYYSWEFGDGATASDKEGLHTYTAKGTYTIKLTVENNFNCKNEDTVKINIVNCQDDSECLGSQECVEGICAFIVAEPPEEPLPETSLEVSITSPTNTIYSTTSVNLEYEANRDTQCSYSLNDGNMIQFSGTSTTITAVEGDNHIILECEDVMLSRSFTVNLGQEQPIEEEQEITQQDIESIIGQLISEGNITITKLGEIEGTSTKLTFRVKNDRMVPLKDIFLNVNFPKSIIQSTNEITTTAPFVIIEEDPIVAFDIGELMPGDDISVVVHIEKIITQTEIETIMTEVATTIDEEALAQMRADIEATANAADVSVTAEEFEKDGETYTRITTTLSPTQKLTDVDLYQEIPKCLAKHIDELNIPNREKLKIINPDPLIVWHFDEIAEDVDLSFDVKGILDPDCIEQIKNMPIAKELGWIEEEPTANKNLFLPLIIILVVILIIIFFAKFKPKHKKTDEKKMKQDKIMHDVMHREEDMGAFFNKHIQEAEEELRRSLK